MKLKKGLLALAVATMLVTVTACGGNGTKNNGQDKVQDKVQDEVKDDADTTVPGEVIKIQVGYENNESEPTAIAVEKWASLVSEKSGGTMELELFPNSALGSKTELIDQMLLDMPVITVADGAYLADYGVADFGILYAPYVFQNWNEAWKAIDSDWYKDISDELAAQAYLRVVGSNWIYGERDFLTTKPVTLPEDISGLKVRVSSNDIAIKSFQNLGVSPVAMEMGEVYTALQAGTIDGVENPIVSLANRSFHEVGKYLVKNNHIHALQIWIASEGFYSTLTEEQQKIIQESADEAGAYNNELYEEATAKAEQTMIDAGVTISEPTEEEYQQWVDLAAKFFERGEEFGWSDNLYENIRNIVK